MSSSNPASRAGERRVNISRNRIDPFGKLSDQAGEKLRRVFRRSCRDRCINVLRDLFDREEDFTDYADAVVVEDDFMGGDLEGVRSSQGGRSEGRTGRGRADPAEPAALQTSIQR